MRTRDLVFLSLIAAAGCQRGGSGPGDGIELQHGAITSATTVNINAAGLSTPSSQVQLWLRGPGVNTLIIGSAVASLADGAYSLSDYNGTAVFGGFTVSGSSVGAPTGAVTITNANVDFDLTKLSSTLVPISTLSNPATVSVVKVGDVAFSPGTDLLLHLPDGTYPVTDYSTVDVYGSFSIIGGVTASAAGAVVPSVAGVTFDLMRLASVRVPIAALSEPRGFQNVRLDSTSGLNGQDTTMYLPDGTYTVTDYNVTQVYGSFRVSGGTIVSTTGAVVPAADGITWDFTQLARVHIPVSTLSSPPGLQVARLPTTNGIFGTDVVMYLPDGTFTLDDYEHVHVYGGFSVAGHAVVGTTGALVAAPGGVGFDFSRLAAVTLPVGDLSSPAGQQVMRAGGIILATTGDATYHLPDGAYTFTDYDVQHTYGTFALTNRRASAAGGWFVAGSDGSVQTSRCALTHVQITVAPGSQARLLDGVAQTLSGRTILSLPDGVYRIENTASAGFTVANHAVSAVWLAGSNIQSVVSVPCVQPPVVTCVGTSLAPATITPPLAVCGATIDNTNGLGGSCRDGGSGVQSCLFDGQSSDLLSPGPHQISVVGTGGDGTQASCTSYVLVPSPPVPAIACPAPKTAECTGPRTTVAVQATCNDTCGCSDSCDQPSTGFALGTTPVTCRAQDAFGGSATCSTSVTIADTQAPSVEVAASPTVLWPVDHKLVPVALEVTKGDLCDPAPVVSCVAISNQPATGSGSGSTSPDIVWTGGQLSLRAERTGNSTDRLYTITCTARDGSGNRTTATTVVTVPHDARR